MSYSELATKLNIRHTNGSTPHNGGQIIKAFVEESELDMSSFSNGGFRIRKRKNKERKKNQS